jgi:hypothetical protein
MADEFGPVYKMGTVAGSRVGRFVADRGRFGDRTDGRLSISNRAGGLMRGGLELIGGGGGGPDRWGKSSSGEEDPAGGSIRRE